MRSLVRLWLETQLVGLAVGLRLELRRVPWAAPAGYARVGSLVLVFVDSRRPARVQAAALRSVLSTLGLADLLR